MVILGGWVFLMSEVPLNCRHPGIEHETFRLSDRRLANWARKKHLQREKGGRTVRMDPMISSAAALHAA